MSSFKEIVTKAVIGKGKKTFYTEHKSTPSNAPVSILGCWVINHNFRGYKVGDKINLEGTYDVNIWYSYDNNSKTDVIKETNSYLETVSIKKNETSDLGNEEIIVRSLKHPTCTNAKIVDNLIEYTIEKELGVEIVGDAKVKVSYNEDEEPWEDLNEEMKDTQNENIINDDIDKNVNENYI